MGEESVDELGVSSPLGSAIVAVDPPGVDVGVVICAYTLDRWQCVCAAIDSVLGQSVAAAQIVVVVDYNDELFERLSVRSDEDDWQGVRVITNEGARGLSDARNSGVRHTSTTVVAFLDDDAVADNDWIRRLTDAYGLAGVRGVGGYVEASWPDETRPYWFPAEFDWVVGCSYVGQPTAPEPVRNFIGANMSMLREDILAANGFRTGVGRVGSNPLGCEETELCIRIGEQHPGSQMLYDPDVRVVHSVHSDRTKVRYFFRRCYAEGLSKALVSRHVGARASLASERAYTRHVLPRGVRTRITSAVVRPSSAKAQVLQAGMMAAGAVVTSAGYVRGRLARTA